MGSSAAASRSGTASPELRVRGRRRHRQGGQAVAHAHPPHAASPARAATSPSSDTAPSTATSPSTGARLSYWSRAVTATLTVCSRGPGAGKYHLQLLRRPRLDQDDQRLGQPVLRRAGCRTHADLDLLPAGDPCPGEAVLRPDLQANGVALLQAALDDPEADREGGLPVPRIEGLDPAVCRGSEPDVAGLTRVREPGRPHPAGRSPWRRKTPGRRAAGPPSRR